MINQNIVYVVMIMLCVVVGILSQYFGLRKDNPVEKAAEAIIKQETGADINLDLPDKPQPTAPIETTSPE